MNPLEPQKSIQIIRNNIISVLSLSIKTILEKSCFQDVLDDSSIEINNFLTILEHVIYFRARGNGFMLSQKMKHHPWKLFFEKCVRIPHNCIPTISQLDNLENNFAKVRAVIRISLIEKRLHEYLSSTFNNKDLNSKYYTSDSIILSGHLPNIINELIGLSAVNFSFDLKLNISHPGFYPIDYCSFLKFYQSPQSVLDDLTECNAQHNKSDSCYWKKNYDMIFAKAKLEAKQKGYLEDVLLNRETTTLALENRNRILESEVKSLETSVTDLQIQLTLLHEQYCKEIERLGGSSTNLIIPSVKSVVGSRAEIMSDRHPISKNIAQIDLDIGKGDNPISPLPQVVPFAFDGIARDCYNKLSKMASTGDLRGQNSSNALGKDLNGNNNRPISEKFTVGTQLISEDTQQYFSPSKETIDRKVTRNTNSQLNNPETSSDISTRLLNRNFEEQRTRIMESQRLRQIMMKASRSPVIKAHRYAQYKDASKSLSFDFLDNYSLDESMSDDDINSRNRMIENDNIIYTNSHNNEMVPGREKQSPNENGCPLNYTNYYYLSSAPASEELSEDNYFNVESSTAVELIHSDTLTYNVNDNVILQPPPELVQLSPLVTAEVPQNMEPLTTRENFHLSNNFINGDRSSERPEGSSNEN